MSGTPSAAPTELRTPEAILLELGSRAIEAKRRLLDGLDRDEWEALADTAARHGLGPLLWLDARDSGVNPPVPVARRLEDLYLHSGLRNRSGGARLAEALRGLASAGVDVIVLKGAHLASGVYTDPAARPMVDHDLLVREPDVARVRDVLAGLGYAPDPRTNPYVEYGEHHHLPPFFRRGAPPIEVHRRLVPRAPRFNLDEDGLWDRAREADVFGARALVLAPDDLLQHLCLHLAWNHRFDAPLLALRDLAEVVAACGGSPLWDRLDARIRSDGSGALVRAPLALVRRRTEAAIPDAVLEGAGSESEVLGLLEAHLLVPPAAAAADVPWSLHRAQPGRERAALVRALFPARAELAAIYGCDPRSPWTLLWYLIRPLDLLIRRGGTAWRLLRGGDSAAALDRDAVRRRLAAWVESAG